jgi:hypothetical protein
MTQSGGSSLGSFVRASSSLDELGTQPRWLARRTLAWLLQLWACTAVTAYDLLLRFFMPSWYMLDLHKFPSSATYLRTRC